MSSPAYGIRNAPKKQQSLLLQTAITSDDGNKLYKSKTLPAGIASCFVSRHLETQTNHVYLRALHDQSMTHIFVVVVNVLLPV